MYSLVHSKDNVINHLGINQNSTIGFRPILTRLLQYVSNDESAIEKALLRKKNPLKHYAFKIRRRESVSCEWRWTIPWFGRLFSCDVRFLWKANNEADPVTKTSLFIKNHWSSRFLSSRYSLRLFKAKASMHGSSVVDHPPGERGVAVWFPLEDL